MKLTITREDLRQFVLKEVNIDISQVQIDIEIEGYEMTEKSLKETVVDELGGKGMNSFAKESIAKLALNAIYGAKPIDKIVTDNEGRVLDIVKEGEEKEPEKPKTRDNRANLKNHPDYTDYENTVLDFATSSEHKRQVPFFGAGTIDCVKERYRKIIKKLGVSDSVKFSRINYLPYLVKIEGPETMKDILNEGVNK